MVRDDDAEGGNKGLIVLFRTRTRLYSDNICGAGGRCGGCATKKHVNMSQTSPKYSNRFSVDILTHFELFVPPSFLKIFPLPHVPGPPGSPPRMHASWSPATSSLNSSRNSTNTLSQLEPKPTADCEAHASFRIHYHIPASLLNPCEQGATPSSSVINTAAASSAVDCPPPTSLSEAQA